MGERCTGHCCRGFFLEATPCWFLARAKELRGFVRDEIDLASRWAEDGGPAFPDEDLAHLAWCLAEAAELEAIGTMIVPVRKVAPTDACSSSDRLGTYQRSGYIYTCVHFDDRTGDCGAYDTRPRMCRDYPYGRRCEFGACEWSAARPSHEVDEGVMGRRVSLVVLLPDEVRTHLRVLDEQLLEESADARALARCRAGLHRGEPCANCGAGARDAYPAEVVERAKNDFMAVASIGEGA